MRLPRPFGIPEVLHGLQREQNHTQLYLWTDVLEQF